MSNVTVNFSLLCSALAVALAAINVWVLPSGILVAAVIALIITLVYAVYELFFAVNSSLQDQSATSGICTSAFLGGSVLGLVAFLIALATGQSAVLSGIAFLIGAASVGCLWYFLSSGVSQVKESLQYIPAEQPPVPLLPPIWGETGSTVYNSGSLPIKRDDLPPLFKDDPLYQMPQPRTAYLFYVVKEGEDACLISRDETRFALSDGASASSLPRPWATLLGQQWIEKPLAKTDINKLPDWLEKSRNLWEEWVKETWLSAVNERNRLTGDYPVHQEDVVQILQRGAFATLLGVEVNRQARKWRALTIGDSCVFMVRRSSSWQIIMSLPLEKSTDFNNRPPLLSSQRDGDMDPLLLSYVKYEVVSYQEGDILLMATDALAQWLLWQQEQGEVAWHTLLEIRDQNSFARFVEKQRLNGMMEEDDTTLLVIPL
jgi:hypothetical protein